MNKTRYTNSPSYGERKLNKLAWFFVGVGVIALLALMGAFHLEGNLPAEAQSQQTYVVR